MIEHFCDCFEVSLIIYILKAFKVEHFTYVRLSLDGEKDI
jgi:hypothetical protein